MLWRPRGVLDEILANRIVAFVETEERTESEPFNRFTDLSNLEAIQIRFGHVFEIAQQRRKAVEHKPPVKSAIYAHSMVGFGVARMYETLMEPSTIDVRAFCNLADVVRWLEVPAELLLEG